MALGTLKRLYGPAYLTGTVADTYLVPASQVAIVYHIHVANIDATTAYTLTLYVDATGTGTAGKELCKTKSIAASDTLDLYFPKGLKLAAAEAITGLGSTTQKLVITVMGELTVA